MAIKLVSAIQKHTTHLLGIKKKASLETTLKANPKTDKRQRGDIAEDLALRFLEKREFRLIERNFNCRLGEIDLIMRDQEYLVFVEVRHRKNTQYGGALESITFSKQAKLRRAAEVYLQNIKTRDCPCRFDILCITGSLQRPNYLWIENAF